MRILVIGKDGQLAKCLKDVSKKFSFEIYFNSKAQLDITDASLLEESILKCRPEVIINCSAYTAVDKAEQYKQDAFAVNSVGVKELAKVCNANSIYLVHISTDYVFDGTGEEYYKESKSPNPSTIYGQSKLSGEEEIIQSNCKYLIIRTAWLFSEHGKNFFSTMIMLAKERNSLKIISDQFGCPTYGPDLAFAIFSAVPYIMKGEKIGLYHFGGFKSCSWDIFAEEIFKEAYRKRVIKKIPAIERVDSKEFVTLAKRPKNSRLDSSLFYSTFNVEPSNWKRGIKKSLEGISK